MGMNKRAKSLSQKLYTKISHMVFPTERKKSKALTISTNTNMTVYNVETSDLTFEYFYRNDILVKIAKTLLAKMTREEMDEIMDNIKKMRECEDGMKGVLNRSSRMSQKRRRSNTSPENGPHNSGGKNTRKTKHVQVIESITSTSKEVVQKRHKKVKRKGKGKWQESKRIDKSSESYTGGKGRKSKNSKSRRTKSKRQGINANLHTITDKAVENKESPFKKHEKKEPLSNKESSKDKSSSEHKEQKPNNNKTSEMTQKPNENVVEDKPSKLRRSNYIKAADGGRHLTGSFKRRRPYTTQARTRTRTRTSERRRSTNERARNSRGDGERMNYWGNYENSKREKETVQKRLPTSKPRRNRLRSLAAIRYQTRQTPSPTLLERENSVVLMSTHYDE
ncbi:hypothetical protein WDU94_007552 [Cyamophila willieti]